MKRTPGNPRACGLSPADDISSAGGEEAGVTVAELELIPELCRDVEPRRGGGVKGGTAPEATAVEGAMEAAAAAEATDDAVTVGAPPLPTLLRGVCG